MIQSFVVQEGHPAKNGGQPGEFFLFLRDGEGPLEFVAVFNACMGGKPDGLKNKANAESIANALRSTGTALASDSSIIADLVGI